MNASLALSLRGIHKQFGAVRALHDVTLDVRAGTVHALLGENGAGKSTLMRIAFGLVPADRGTVAVHGSTCASPFTPSIAIAAGVGMVHQHFSLVSAMTVSENVALGSHGRYDPATVHAEVQRISERTGLALDPTARVSDLPVSAQQRCEIVKALARNARLLILDEPTAVLAPDEAQALLTWLRAFVTEDPSHAVVLITHKLRDALAMADDVTVLRHGHQVATGAADTFTEASLADAMLGPGDRTHALQEERMPRLNAPTGSVSAPRAVITAHAIDVRDPRDVLRVRGASFAVRAGEIVGVAAVEGSGQHELLRAVAGMLPLASGRLSAPRDIAFVPEDRHRDALLLDASLTENLALRDAGARSGRMPWPTLATRTANLLAKRDVRARDAHVNARTLSGGNQQKFILARALHEAPPALIAENPTRGLDFRATADVHDALRDARDAGIAVLLYSSDLDEVLALADRVLALHHGVVQEVPRDRAIVGRAMLGAS